MAVLPAPTLAQESATPTDVCRRVVERLPGYTTVDPRQPQVRQLGVAALIQGGELQPIGAGRFRQFIDGLAEHEGVAPATFNRRSFGSHSVEIATVNDEWIFALVRVDGRPCGVWRLFRR